MKAEDMTFEQFVQHLYGGAVDWLYWYAEGDSYRRGMATVQEVRKVAVDRQGQWYDAFMTAKAKFLR